MNFHPGFVQELRKNPWDKTTTSIYLDWLKDEGQNPVMAELVELLRDRPYMLLNPVPKKYLECLIPPTWGYSRWAAKFTKQIPQLVLSDRGDWFRGMCFGSGWASVVSCSLAAWMRGAKWICERHPVQTLLITGPTLPEGVTPNLFRWHQCSHIYQAMGALLPPEIFNLLQLGKWDDTPGQWARCYSAAQQAVNDLTLAALRYGRKLAGHPVEVTPC